MIEIDLRETENGWTVGMRDGDSTYPTIEKKTAREAVQRIMQVLELGPLAPQNEPEIIGVDLTKVTEH